LEQRGIEDDICCGMTIGVAQQRQQYMLGSGNGGSKVLLKGL